MTNQPPSDADVRAHLASRYGVEAARLSLPESHNPFVLRVRRDDGPDWIVRLFHPARPVERADGEADILNYLERQGYPAERCAADHPVSQLGDRCMLVTEHAGEGAQENAAMYPVLHTEDALFELGALLGRLHLLPEEAGSVARPGGAWHGDPSFEGLPSRDIAATAAMLDELDPRVPESGRDAFQALRDRVAELAARWTDELPTALVHPDFMWKNVVVAPHGQFVLVDWTGAGQGPRVCNFVDLANTTMSDRGVDKGKLRAVVEGYRQHVELTAGELEAVPDARRIRQLRFAVLTYHASANFGYFGTGGEGWWPNDAQNVALGEAVRSACSASSSRT